MKLIEDNLSQCFSINPNFDQLLIQTDEVIANIKAQQDEDPWPLFETIKQNQDLLEIESITNYIKNNYKSVIIFGMGGSTMNGMALSGLRSKYQAQLDINFINNIDPLEIELLISKIDFLATHFIFISKSGETPEVIAQIIIIIKQMRHHHSFDYQLGRHFTIITELQNSSLIKIANSITAKVLAHPNLGGRFAALTLVGLLPASLAGLDINKFRIGAKRIIDDLFDYNQSTIQMAVVTHLNLMSNNYNLNVLMSYIDQLIQYSNWYRQLWAESLGKAGVGSTVITALGATDQHSQLQLYLDGPKDKFFTIISLANYQSNIDLDINDSILSKDHYLRGHNLSNLMLSEQKATIDSLIENKCPIRRITIQKLNEETIGMLMMQSMLETIICGYLLKINPFDQPAVEQIKIKTKKFLNH